MLSIQSHTAIVILGVLVVGVLAIGPKVCGCKSGRGQWIFKGDKIGFTTSFGAEVKPLAPCRKILLHGKEP
jgi:hypothetical protein